MTKLNELKISEALDGMAKGDFTSVELTQDCITAMEQTKELNAFIVETPGKAREMAAASDARRAKGEAGVMEGIPIGMKDLFCTQGTQTTAASHILEGFVPQYESTVSQNLWNAGSVMLGKLNLDELRWALPTSPLILAMWLTLGSATMVRTPGWFLVVHPADLRPP